MGWEKELALANQAKAKKRREEEQYQKELKKRQDALNKPPKMTQPRIWDRVEEAIGSSFPDGDPIDHLSDLFDKHQLTMDQIDRAINRFAKVKNGMYGYLATMWQDRQADQMADARAGAAREYSQFYRICDGQVIPKDNPWASDL